MIVLDVGVGVGVAIVACTNFCNIIVSIIIVVVVVVLGSCMTFIPHILMCLMDPILYLGGDL